MTSTRRDDLDLLSPSAVARIFDLEERTLADWRYRGGGPPYLRLGHKTVRYRTDELRRWLAAREETAR